jgi:hypothetical protein
MLTEKGGYLMYPLTQKVCRLIKKAYRGQMGAYAQVLAVLLLLAAGFYAALFTTGAACYDPILTNHITSWDSQRRANWSPDFRVRLQANARQARPGERATRTLGGEGDPLTTKVSYSWSPPWGATNLSYDPAPDDPGPPPVWLDRAPTQQINISYDQPSLPAGETTMLATDTALAEWDGYSSGTSFTTLITNEPSQPNVPPSLAATSARTNAAATAELWEVSRWVDQPGITMTTDLCQDWFTLLQDDDAFLALRAPVSPTAALTESYPLPIVFGGEYSNTLQLLSYSPFGPVITVPVELRPERHTFLETELPSAPGEHWMALGLISDTVTCPGYDLAADGWSFLVQGYLDMTHQPDNCEGCVLLTYYCYEGQEAPLVKAASRVLGASADVTSYQGWGITCVGPQAAPLLHEHAWHLGGASSAWVTPTMTITFHHHIELDPSSDPMTFTLDYTDTLGVGWSIYGGDWAGPDTGDPITPAVAVPSGGWQHLWMISDPVPGDTAAGAYTLVITATSVVSPTDSLWAVDAIWVGDWVAPPTTGYDRYVYLPLVVRSQ